MNFARKGRDAGRFLVTTAMTGVLAFSAQSAFAQSEQTAGASDGFGVQEIIVTARKRAEDLQSQPLSITALTTEALTQKNVQRLDDLTSVPNVNFNNSSGYANSLTPTIRGIGESDPFLSNDSPVGFYVDGVLYARQIGTLLEVMDPERIEILRGPQSSLFGRNTTGGAVSITTKAPTEEAGAEFYGGYASDNEYVVRATVNSGRIGDIARLKLTAQHRQMDGYVRNLNTNSGKYWYGSNNVDALFGTLHLGNDGPFSADLRGDWTDTKGFTYAGQTTVASPSTVAYYGQSPSFGGDPLVISDRYLSSLYGVPAPRSQVEVWGTSLTLNYEGSEAFNLKSITAYRHLRNRNYASVVGQGDLRGIALDTLSGAIGVMPVSPFEVPPTINGQDTGGDSRQHQWSEELQVSGTIGQHKYVAGIFLFRERYSEFLTYDFTYPPDSFPATPIALKLYNGVAVGGTSKSAAIYVSDTWTPPILNDQLEVTGGFRYTYDKKTIAFPGHPYNPLTGSNRSSYKRPSGDVTLSYHWTPDVMTYFRYANGYKSGGFSGRDSPTQTGFAPETANNFEIGLKSTLFDRRVRFNATAFYTKYSNKQVSVYSPNAAGGQPVNSVKNAGRASYTGVEAELVVVPVRELELSATFGYTDPKYQEFLTVLPTDTTGTVINIADQAVFGYFSKTSFSLGARYSVTDLPVGRLTLAMNYAYQSGQYFHPSILFSPLNDILRGGSRKDLSANITLAEIPLGSVEGTVSLYAKNLLNEHWRISGVDYEFGFGFNYGTNAYNRPRVFGAALGLKF